jgi:hypothetical protein
MTDSPRIKDRENQNGGLGGEREDEDEILKLEPREDAVAPSLSPL